MLIASPLNVNRKTTIIKLIFAISLIGVLTFYFVARPQSASALLTYDYTNVDYTGSNTAVGFSNGTSISGDGNLVVFSSKKSDLVPSDTNNRYDIFLKNMSANTIKRISVLNGVQSAQDSSHAKISNDGKFIAWSALTSSNRSEVYLYNVATETQTLISKHMTGTSVQGKNTVSDVSENGRYILFTSNDYTLDANVHPTSSTVNDNVYLADTKKNTIKNYSLNASGTLTTTGTSGGAHMSCDARYITFWTAATDLVPNDTNASTDVILYDRIDGGERKNITQGGDEVSRPNDISCDGKYLTLTSAASNLFGGTTTQYQYDAYVYDIENEAGSNISKDTNGVALTTSSEEASQITDDGRHVLFNSDSSGLAGQLASFSFGQTPGGQHSYVKDLKQNTIQMLDGWQDNGVHYAYATNGGSGARITPSGAKMTYVMPSGGGSQTSNIYMLSNSPLACAP